MSDNNYKNRIKKLREFSEKNKLCFCIAMALAYLFSVCHIISKNKILKNCIITIATLIVVGIISFAVVYSGLLEQLTGNKASAVVTEGEEGTVSEAEVEGSADVIIGEPGSIEDNNTGGSAGSDTVAVGAGNQTAGNLPQVTPVSKAGQATSIITENKDYSSFDKNAWNLLLVNKQHPIPEDYSYTLGSISGSMKCDERIIEPLNDMINAANEEGIYLKICSPYRDLDRQEYLFKKKMKQYLNSGDSFIDAYREASSVVTVPGASEHEIGLSLDIVSTDHQALDEKFGETDAGQWLMNNAYKFGFILRYPKGKEDITGIIYEPWHYRYVGREAAEIIYEEQITLEEFIEKL